MSGSETVINFDSGDPESMFGAKQEFEDGTNLAVGIPFREEFTTRALPWYVPAEANGSHNWRDNLAKLRSRFDNFIDEHCATECFLIQSLIPQIGEVPRKPPGILPDRELLCSGQGLRREPARLFGIQKPIAASFPMMNVRGEPLLEPDGKPMPFRLGLTRNITVLAIPDGLRELPIPKLTELLGDGKNILFQLPPAISVKIWWNWLSGFSQRYAQFLWLDALFEMSWQRECGGSFHTDRYAWFENGSVALSGKGLFPRLPDINTSSPGEFAPHENGYPRTFYSQITDIARASVAAIDEILSYPDDVDNWIPSTIIPNHKVFISYSHADEKWKDLVTKHLSVLAEETQLELWDDRKIVAGDDWLPEVEKAIKTCNAALLLISADFLTSNFILRKEVPSLLKRRQKEGVRLIPVILRPCAWKSLSWLKGIQARPKDGKPLSSLTKNKQEEALTILTEELSSLLSKSRPPVKQRVVRIDPGCEQATRILTGQASVVKNPLGKPPILPPKTLLPALHQIPAPPPDFAGRTEDLAELVEKLRRGGVTISGLHGMGGVGKTTLALKLAEKLTPQYPDAQIYLDLKGASPSPLSTSEAMAHVIRAWHPDAKIPTKGDELRGTYLSVLYNRHVLLLMDNAGSKEQVEPLIPPSTCAMLVTSRSHFTLPGLFPWALETLMPADARGLVMAIAPRLSGQVAAALAKLCGYLPLALRLAASALAERNDLKPEDYLRRLRHARKRLELADASLNMSYELLEANLQKCWTKLAVFPESFDSRAASTVLGLNSEKAKTVLEELAAFSMLEWNVRNERYKLHDLAKLFADQLLDSPIRDDSRSLHSIHFKTVLTEANEFYLRGGKMTKRGLALFDSEWVNIQAGFAWAKVHASKNATAAELCFAYPDIGVFLLDLRQSPHETVGWLSEALKVARRLKKRDQEGSILSYLGNAHAASGDYKKAAVFCKRALHILQSSRDYRQEAYALSNLGWCCTELGQVSYSIKVQKQALKIFRRLRDDRGVGTALGRQGRAYAAKGMYRESIRLQTQYLKFALKIGNRRGEGYALGQLGKSYAALGDFRLADKFYRRHLRIARDIGDLRGEADALLDMGLALFALGKVSDAITHAESALKVLNSIKHQKSAEVKSLLAKWR